MGDTPQTTNTTVGVAEKVIHGVLVDVAAEAAITAATVAAPWLRLPVIRQVFRFIVVKFAELFSAQLERAAAFMIIDTQVNNELSAYKEAVGAIKAAEAAGDLDALQKAREEFKKTLGRLIHSDGS